MYLLVVEDRPDVAYTLKLGLEAYGYHVDVAHDGIEGEVKATTNAYDLLVVDWMLPGQDGPHLIQRLRTAGIDVPALMLTARSEKQDLIDALDMGADDYLAKPFSFEVLQARLRALARRARADATSRTADLSLTSGPLHLDLSQRTAVVGTTEVALREKEFQLLVVLAENANRVITRTLLVERVWDSLYVSDDVLNTTMASLRRKLQQAARGAGPPALTIETLRSVGYRLRVNEHPGASGKAA